MLNGMAHEKLEHGQDSIDRSTPSFNKDRGVWTLTWRVRDYNGKLHTKRSQGRTKGIARRRARQKCEEILTVGAASTWKPSDLCEDYIDKVVIPAIQNSGRKPRTIQDYTRSIGHMRTQSKGMPLSALRKPKTVVALFDNVAANSGPEAARQMRSVTQNYMFREMILDNLLDHDPTKGMSIQSLKVERNDKYTPTPDEWWDMVKWVLADDLDQPMPGKTTPQARKKAAIARHRRAAELTLLQMATGLRITEAITLRWQQTTIDKQGHMWITVAPEQSKTAVGRTVPVLIPQVETALAALRETRDPGAYVIPQPTSDKPWDRSNATGAVRDYYDGISQSGGPEFAAQISSHAWRRTLNTMMAPYLPVEVRAAYFGHTEQMNRRSYTDPVQVLPVMTTVHQIIEKMDA